MSSGLAATAPPAACRRSERSRACPTQFPGVRLERGKRFVQSGPALFTAGGLTSGIDLALHVVDLYFGREVAEKTATYMEYEGTGWRRTDS